MIDGSTRVFAVLGDPVRHSLSPRMHGAAFRALGVDAVYVALPASPADVGPLVRALCRGGGGASITAPCKEAAAALVDRPSPRVRDLGMCNTVWRSAPDGDAGRPPADGVIAGENTDVDGVLASMRELCIEGGAWLVAGTGGAAKAVAAAAALLGARIAVRSRDPARAGRFAAWLDGLGVAAAEPAECHVLVNATPLGRRGGDPLPIERNAAPRATAALDLVYARGGTPWVRSLAAAGLHAIDGRTMLLAQGVAAFTRWFPEVDPPVDIMRAAVTDALR